jgi:hypothetical protein
MWNLVLCTARLGLKAAALAWPEPALASSNLRPGQSRHSRLGSGLAWPRPWLLYASEKYFIFVIKYTKKELGYYQKNIPRARDTSESRAPALIPLSCPLSVVLIVGGRLTALMTTSQFLLSGSQLRFTALTVRAGGTDLILIRPRNGSSGVTGIFDGIPPFSA